MTTHFTDRSRILQYQRCPRSRYLGYHQNGAGIATISKSLPLVVGGAVHRGIEVLLRAFIGDKGTIWPAPDFMSRLEEEAVAAALIDFAQYAELELDPVELAGMGSPKSDEAQKIAETLGLAVDDPQVIALQAQVGQNWTKFDRYLKAEQTALVEAMVRAYARRRLRALLEQFEVLEVEREGMWTLADMPPTDADFDKTCKTIQFMSRPDALLRDRESNELVILSLKTAASWDVRKARDAEHDMQGLSEGVEVELRLGKQWAAIHASLGFKGSSKEQVYQVYYAAYDFNCDDGSVETIPAAMTAYLAGLSSAPRIHAIRYEYMLKGQRRADKELTAQLGMDCKSQGSHLVRGLLNKGMASGDEKWCWSWNFTKDDGTGGSLHYKTWKGAGIWEHMTVKQWIDLLDAAAPAMSAEDATVGLEPRLLGYQCEVQSGFTDTHPLDEVFLTPITMYRNDDDLRDWMDATEAQEQRIVEGLVQIQASTDQGEVRHLMNVYFPMVRQACEWPGPCSFIKVCYGGAEIKLDPVASGQYEARKPNHPQERGE